MVGGRLLERDDHAVGRAKRHRQPRRCTAARPNEDPIGKRVRYGQDAATGQGLTVVGVVGDVRLRAARAASMAPEIRALLREYAPEAPMYRIFTMEGLADRALAQLTFTTLLLAIASGLALVLGAVGLYGVLSYVVSQRTREIAVRMTLGAERSAVRQMVVVQGGRVALIGVGAASWSRSASPRRAAAYVDTFCYNESTWLLQRANFHRSALDSSRLN